MYKYLTTKWLASIRKIGHRRQGDAEVVEDRLELGHDQEHDEDDDHAGDEDDHDG